MRKGIITLCCEGLVLGFGRLANTMFPEIPFWLLILSMVVFAVAIPLTVYFDHWKGYVVRCGVQQLSEVNLWKLIAIIAIVLLVGKQLWEPSIKWLQSSIGVQEAHVDILGTQPTCLKEVCENQDWIMLDCERRAKREGTIEPRGLRRNEREPILNRGLATEYFRGCLLDKGLSWRICSKGDDNCYLFTSPSI